MILSASVNADVPAHYGEWFQRRLEAGYLRVAGSDPWKQSRIELDRAHIDGIVFWTRDIMPFLHVLETLRAQRIAFVVQYALTADSTEPVAKAAIAAIRQLAQRYGPRVGVWRYDPVAVDANRSTPLHHASFAGLARALAGSVDETVIAFARATRRTDRATGDVSAASQVQRAADQSTGIEKSARRELVRALASIAADCGMRLGVCSDAEALAPGSSPARCIDARRLADVAGQAVEAPTAGFMRDCLCARAIDIGDQGSPEPERFCGADPNRRRHRQHNPQSEFLFEARERFKPVRSGDLPF
jgi:nucleotide-binding universal stress UspA family protein